MPRKFTRSMDGVMRCDVHAIIRATAGDLRAWSDIAQAHGCSLQALLRDALQAGLWKELEDYRQDIANGFLPRQSSKEAT